MSRFNDEYDDEDYNNQALMQWANTERAMAGKNGRKWLTELRDELLAMTDKRIGHGSLVTATGAVCAVGAVVVAHRVASGEDRDHVLADLRKRDIYCAECTHAWHESGDTACGVPTEVWDPMALSRWSTSTGTVWMGADVPGRCPCNLFTPASYEAYADTIAAAVEIGMPRRVAIGISYENDEGLTTRPGEDADRTRYRQLLAWVIKQLALPPLTRPARREKKRRGFGDVVDAPPPANVEQPATDQIGAGL